MVDWSSKPSDPVADMKRAFDQVKAAVAEHPPVWRIYAHHSVPYGSIFHQWDTKGRKIVWVNRGELNDLPIARKEFHIGVLGIPVFEL